MRSASTSPITRRPTLDYTIWLTPLDEAGDQRVDSPTDEETRLTTPRIPGLEVRIPAGTVITDAAGHAVKKLNITAIPVDRPPFPLPPFVSVPIYFTVQPGRAYLSKGAQVIYPNWSHLPPGQRVDFWNYDPDDRGWYVYGHGTVTPDGKQVVPGPRRPRLGVHRRDDHRAAHRRLGSAQSRRGATAAIRSTSTPASSPTSKTDLRLPDTIPIVIERTYRPGDSNSYSFGIGTTSLYDLRLWSTNNYKEADLILPDGGRVHYVRTSPGTGWTDAVYRATSSAGPVLRLDDHLGRSRARWDLKLTSGITYVFGEIRTAAGDPRPLRQYAHAHARSRARTATSPRSPPRTGAG